MPIQNITKKFISVYHKLNLLKHILSELKSFYYEQEQIFFIESSVKTKY